MIFDNTARDPFASREPVRPAVPRDHRGYICPNCDLVLADGVAYEWCPVCFAAVDWVDLRQPVWACGGCDAMVNDAVGRPWCEDCERHLLRVHKPARRNEQTERTKRDDPVTAGSLLERTRRLVIHPRAIAVLYLLSLLPVLLLALDEQLRWSMVGVAAPFIFLPVLIGVLLLGSVGASWRELRALIGNRAIRVVHGLEHATLKLLEQRGAPIAGGQTEEDSSFIACFRKGTGWGYREKNIRRALRDSVTQIQSGNTDLVYDRRCGTSYLVGALMLALLAVLACALAFLVTMSIGAIMLTFVFFAVAMAFGARPLGLLAQRLFTVSHEFERARLVKLVRMSPANGLLRYRISVGVELNRSAATN